MEIEPASAKNGILFRSVIQGCQSADEGLSGGGILFFQCKFDVFHFFTEGFIDGKALFDNITGV